MRAVFKILSALLPVVQGLLWVRFVFKLFGVGSSNILVYWLYKITGIFLVPFAGIFPDGRLFGFVIEFNTLLAIVAYALLHSLIGRIARAV